MPISLSTEVLRDERGEFLGVVEFFRDLTEVEHVREALEQEKVLGTIVSASPVVRRVIQMLPNIAESECNVTIHGPSGSGKELFAEAIHKLSPRRYGPYIKLNCAALPATLLESELFGYVKGAFTDAKRDKPGLFALANGGTLLLDEISEMDVSLQVKLLRVLADGEYQPLGATRTLKTDARVIAATNADLQECHRRGTVPGGPVLPHQRRGRRASAAAGPAGGHPAAGGALHREGAGEDPQAGAAGVTPDPVPSPAVLLSRATSASCRTPSSTPS